MIDNLSIEIKQSPEDSQITFDDDTIIRGYSIPVELNEEEKIVPDMTVINSYSIELLDYPLYAFQLYFRRYPKGTFT